MLPPEEYGAVKLPNQLLLSSNSAPSALCKVEDREAQAQKSNSVTQKSETILTAQNPAAPWLSSGTAAHKAPFTTPKLS